MSTLLEVLATLSPEQMAAGESVEVVDSAGVTTTITFGARISAPDNPLSAYMLP